MNAEEQFGRLASLIGEPARASILWNLLDGRAFTATELSLMAEVSPQSASMHLSKLVQAGLLAMQHQGRHRYYSLAGPEVAHAIESIASLLPAEKKGPPAPPITNGHIRYCRTCYDHLAGKIGVALTEGLVKNALIVPADHHYEVTKEGMKWWSRLGINIDKLQSHRRVLARQCLDWSERRHHLAGSLGAALLEKMLAGDWVRRTKNSRAVILTAKGEKKLQELLGLAI